MPLDRDGNYIQHYGVKGMKWKNHKYVDPKMASDVARSRQLEIQRLKNKSRNIAKPNVIGRSKEKTHQARNRRQFGNYVSGARDFLTGRTGQRYITAQQARNKAQSIMENQRWTAKNKFKLSSAKVKAFANKGQRAVSRSKLRVSMSKAKTSIARAGEKRRKVMNDKRRTGHPSRPKTSTIRKHRQEPNTKTRISRGGGH